MSKQIKRVKVAQDYHDSSGNDELDMLLEDGWEILHSTVVSISQTEIVYILKEKNG